MAERNEETFAAIALQKELASDVRVAVNRLRNYGITLKDVHAALAAELGRTAASLPDREGFVRWLAEFARLALDAYDLEREDLAAQAQPRPTRKPR